MRNGYECMAESQQNTCKIWAVRRHGWHRDGGQRQLRMQSELYCIVVAFAIEFAHTASCLRFDCSILESSVSNMCTRNRHECMTEGQQYVQDSYRAKARVAPLVIYMIILEERD